MTLADGAEPIAARVARSRCCASYKILISPLFAGSCRFLPSCSDYTAEAVARHGVAAGQLAGAAAARAGATPWGHGSTRSSHWPGCRLAAGAAAREWPDHSMEKRVLLAVILSFVVLYGYQALFPPTQARSRRPPQPTPPGGRPAARPRPSRSAPAADRPRRPRPGTGRGRGAAPPRPLGGRRPRSATSLVETRLGPRGLHHAGRRLKSWQLKKYPDDAGSPLDLVPADVPPARVAAVHAVDRTTPPIDATLQQALFKPSGGACAPTRQAPRHAGVRLPGRGRPDGAQGVRVQARPALRSSRSRRA